MICNSPTKICLIERLKINGVGLPYYPPSIAVNQFCADKAIVYASWNGATETAAWQVLAGPEPDRLLPVVYCTPRTGFETGICVNADWPYFLVNALNYCGEVIGTSRIVHVCKQQC